MDRPVRLEHHRKQSHSLHRAYIMVGVVGMVMLVFVLINFINARRLDELTSPLWTAVREVKLEAAALEHEAKDLVRGQRDPAAETLWFYLDQSIWHLANLLKSHQQNSHFMLFAEKMDVSGRIETISEQLRELKLLVNAQSGQVKTPEALAAAITRFDELAAGFRFQLDEMEADISQLILKEQLQQRIFYAVLVVFCVSMIALVAFQIRRYERYRKESYETLSGANTQLARQIEERRQAEHNLHISYAFLKIANDNREIKPMLNQFIAAIQSYTGCSECAIRLLYDDDTRIEPAGDNPCHLPCELDLNSPTANRSMCLRVVNKDVDVNLPWFTQFGSYFLDLTANDGDAAGSGPERCEQSRCFRLGYRSMALVPIKVGTHHLGLIQIADVREGLIAKETVELMETAAMHVGAALRRLRAEEKLENAYHELEDRVSERTQAISQMNETLQSEIEERRQIENRLRKNRNTLQTLIDGIGDALILVDKDMQIRMLNQVAAVNYQVASLEQVVGKLCYEKIGNSGSCSDCPIPRAVRRSQNYTFERQGLDDPERLERITIYPVKQPDDASGGAIIRISDITEEKRLEQQLIQSEKMASLGILVSSIGHEINNPNNFITFNIPILRDYLDALVRISDRYAKTQADFELFHMSYDDFRQDVFKLVDNIEHGASRISSFVSNLREFSQNNGHRKKVWLELSQVIDKVLSICRSQIKKRIRDFRVDIPDGQPKIYADEYSLEQVLLNLIVNAVQAADKVDATVSVSASTGDSWQDTTIITVSDNGCGMDDIQLEKIFNPFFTTKSASEGTGLGLYVCLNLVQRLGGRIEVESKKGEGSTFTILLPDKERRAKARD